MLRKEKKKISLVQIEKGSFVKYYHLPVEWEKNPELFSARFGQPKLLPAVMHIIRDKRKKKSLVSSLPLFDIGSILKLSFQ